MKYTHGTIRLPVVVVATIAIVVAPSSMTPLSAQGEGLGTVVAGTSIVKNVIDILKEANTARSVVLEVDNNTNFNFRRVSDHHAHGGWAKPPKADIPAKSSDVFGSQSTGGSVGTGTEGNVTYTNGEGLQFTIKWSNPFGGSNSCDVSVSGPQSDIYRVKASCGSGEKGAHMRYEAYRSDWRRLPGCAKDIGIDQSGIAWIVGCTSGEGPNNLTIRKWNPAEQKWDPIGGGGVRIAVEPGGTPWLVNAEGKIYRRSGNSWGNPLPGCAQDVGADGMGRAWVIGCSKVGIGYSIHRKNPTDAAWSTVDGSAVGIAVEPNGRPWVINASREIYQRDKKDF